MGLCLRAAGAEGSWTKAGRTHGSVKLWTVSVSPHCVPRKPWEGLWGTLAQPHRSRITAITELSLRGQPSTKTGPKIPADGCDSCPEREFDSKAPQGAQGLSQHLQISLEGAKSSQRFRTFPQPSDPGSDQQLSWYRDRLEQFQGEKPR